MDFTLVLHLLQSIQMFGFHFIGFPLQSAAPPMDEEFNLFLFTLVLIGFILIVICIVIGILLTLLLMLLIFGLISLGALSASILIGINKQSFTKGFKAFVIVFSTVASGLLGAVSFYVLARILHWGQAQTATLFGSAAGLLGGLALGYALAIIIQKFSQFLKAKLRIQ